MHIQSLLFGSTGHLSRVQWWIGMSLAVIMALSIMILRDGLGLIPFYEGFGSGANFSPLLIAINTVLLLIGVVAGITVTVKRLRARGRSELWILGFVLFPLFQHVLVFLFFFFDGPAVATSHYPTFYQPVVQAVYSIVPLAYNVLIVWLVFELGFAPEKKKAAH